MSEMIVLDCVDSGIESFINGLAYFTGKAVSISVQTIVETDDPDLADAIRALIKAREKAPVKGDLEVIEPDEDFTDVLDAPDAEPPTSVSEWIAVIVPQPDPDPHGMIAAPVSERDTICAHCGQHFIRRRKDQTYCMKPDCQRAKRNECQKAYKYGHKKDCEVAETIAALKPPEAQS